MAIAVLATIVLGGVILRSLHLDDVTQRTPDERTYIGYATRIAQQGPGAERKIIAEFEADEQLWNYPPPTRVGHIFLLAAVMRVFGTEGAFAGVALSWVCSILSLILTARIGLRYFNATIAITAVFLLATSFAELALVRRAWQDSTFGFFSLLVIYLALEVSRTPNRAWVHATFHLAGAWCVLMKQTGPIVYGVALLWLMADLGFRERTRGALRVALGGATALALVMVLMIVLTGSLAVAWSSAIHSYAMPPEGMGYLISCCGGPWWQVGWTVALANPLALSLAAVGIVAPVSFRWSTWRYVALPAAMVLAFLASVSFMPLRQSLRYTSPAHGAFCLLAGYGLWRILEFCSRKLEPGQRWALYAMATSALLIAAVGEYRVFEAVSIEAETPDLGTLQIRQVLGR